MTLSPRLRDAALRWMADDPDPDTRTELQRVLAAAMVGDTAALADLTDRMRAPLRFGTAGLRGPVRAGPAGMNVAVVRRTTAGLATWLAAHSTDGDHGPRDGAGGGQLVVVGRDARHGSAAFAAAAAEVLAGAGFDVGVLPEPLPTPVLAFAVQHLGAVAGVQITASHNPPGDNGYKVYLGGHVAADLVARTAVAAISSRTDGADGNAPADAASDRSGGAQVVTSDPRVVTSGPREVTSGPRVVTSGAQLVAPADAEIEAAIAAAPPAADIVTATGARTVDVIEEYLDRVGRLPRGSARALRVALTPLHGVGGATAVHALRRAGFTDVHVVPTQAVPDPDFPTVTMPNPEEPGASDALLALAADVDADLAVALDPDADRCALGVPLPSGGGREGEHRSERKRARSGARPGADHQDSGWRMLSGDETGVLLGDHLLRSGSAGDVPHGDPLVATTVVSSSMLRAVAAAYGARYAETLTGFKWIVRAGPGLVFGYEEALGYCVDPDAVRDKDGIAAAVLACDLAAGLRVAGGSLLTRLDELAVRHGVHRTQGISVRYGPGVPDDADPPSAGAVARPATPPSAGAGIAGPGTPPSADAGAGGPATAAGTTPQAAVARLAAAPPQGWAVERPAPDVLVLRRAGERVVVRPSGTEPKLKAYLEVVEAPDPDVAAARTRADRRLDALRTELLDLLGT